MVQVQVPLRLTKHLLKYSLNNYSLYKTFKVTDYTQFTSYCLLGQWWEIISHSCSLFCSPIPLFLPENSCNFFFSTKRYLQVLVSPRSIAKPKASCPEGEIQSQFKTIYNDIKIMKLAVFKKELLLWKSHYSNPA